MWTLLVGFFGALALVGYVGAGWFDGTDPWRYFIGLAGAFLLAGLLWLADLLDNR